MLDLAFVSARTCLVPHTVTPTTPPCHAPASPPQSTTGAFNRLPAQDQLRPTLISVLSCAWRGRRRGIGAGPIWVLELGSCHYTGIKSSDPFL